MARVASRFREAAAFQRLRTVVTSRPAVAHAAAVLITVYAGMLTIDAFISKYRTLEHPAWARVATHGPAPLAAHLRPETVVWWREQEPYVGGDPINYLKSRPRDAVVL